MGEGEEIGLQGFFVSFGGNHADCKTTAKLFLNEKNFFKTDQPLKKRDKWNETLQFRKSCGIWEMGQFAVKGRVNNQSQESCKKRKTQKMKLLMNYIIKISQSTRDEIVKASLFSAHAWKNVNLSKNHWVNLRKENDCAWKCLGDGVCQLMNWEATVCSSLHSKDIHKLSPKKEIFSFSPLRGIQGHFALCFICNSFFSFIKPGDYWEEKVCSKWLGKGSRLLTPPGSHLPSGLLILMTSLYHSVSQLCQQLPPTAQWCFLC